MKGQTLIEVLIALAIAVVVISAATVTAISSLSSAQFIQQQNIATKYAQEGIEVIRKLRNSNYIGFRNYSGLYCFGSGASTLGSPVAACNTANIGTTYIRSVNIQQNACGANIPSVAIIVAFTSGKCSSGSYCHTSKMSSCLSTVNPVVGP